MMLLTAENRKNLPPLYSQEKVKDPIAWVKFFDPTGSWTWYCLEFDGKDTFFGLVDGHEKELGYFSLSELKSVRGRFGLGIERDMYFSPMPLSWVKNSESNPDPSGGSRYKVTKPVAAKRKSRKSSTPGIGRTR